MASKLKHNISFFGLSSAKNKHYTAPSSNKNMPTPPALSPVNPTELLPVSFSTQQGLKTQLLTVLSNQGLPIPAGFSIPAHDCKALNSEAQKPQKSALLEALKVFHFTPERNVKIKKSHSRIFLIARMSPHYDLTLSLPFVAGLGFTPTLMKGLETKYGVASTHYHYQRFIVQYSTLVWGIDDWIFEDLIYDYHQKQSLKNPTDYRDSDWHAITALFLTEIKTHYKKTIPETLEQQCVDVLEALAKQWQSSKFKLFRQIHNLPEKPEPAFIVQTMLFSPADSLHHQGLCYSRHPQSGEKGLFGQFFSGFRTPLERLNSIQPCKENDTISPLKNALLINKESQADRLSPKPDQIISQVETMARKLEKLFGAAVQFDFVSQGHKIWLLNASIIKTDSHATIKIACDHVKEGIITKEQAVCRPDPADLSHLLHHSLKLNDEEPLLTAMPASLGASHGKVALDRHTALSYAQMGEDVILVRPETDPEDVYAIHSVAGVLTSQGGNSSHAAVIARSMGCPCIVGAKEMVFTKNETSLNNQSFSIGNQVFKNGDYITIDGEHGTVYRGKVALQEPVFPDELNQLLGWADDAATMSVRANADSIEETICALNFGAKGIGLCRTEHMLLTPEALFHFRRVLLENDPEQKSAALQDILRDQKTKLTQILHEMAGHPVTIRLLDPPLHEFLPKDPVEIEALATILERPVAELQEIVKSLEEKNPMLGHRGCRLAITLPEILEIQTKAILEAAKDVYIAQNLKTDQQQANGQKGNRRKMSRLEIMIPFVMLEKEIELLVTRIKTIAETFCKTENIELNYRIGTMIEIPRAALRAQKIALHTDFFSFGTNDLTQTVWALSRDDADSFLRDYYASDLLRYDPFKTLDQDAVGSMIAHACVLGKKGNPNLSLGICGEHGADPASISFFQSLDLDYISCSPFQVPIARLAAGQAAIKQEIK